MFSLQSYSAYDRNPARDATAADLLALLSGPPTDAVLRLSGEAGQGGQAVRACRDHSAHTLDIRGGTNRFPFERTHESRTVPVDVVAVADATIVGDEGCVVTGRGDLLLESLWPFRRSEPFAGLMASDRIRALGESVERLDVTALHIAHHGCDNYYHWHKDALPNIVLLKRLGALDRIHIAVPTLKSWQRRSLERLGIDPARICELGNRPHRFGQVLLLSNTYRPGVYADDWTVATFHALLAGSPVPPPPAPEWTQSADLPLPPPVPDRGRLLYVSRLDAGLRRLFDEERLVAILRGCGFTILEGSGLTYDQQIAAFHHAEMVVGVHGAGLTNLGFCRPGTTVLELLPFGFLEAPHYFLFGSAFDLDYHMHASSVPSKGSLHDGWSINLDEFLLQFITLFRDRYGIDLTERIAALHPRSPISTDSRPCAADPLDLRFDSEGGARDGLWTPGFSGTEGWGTWISGPRAAIVFGQPLPAAGRIVLDCTFFEPGTRAGVFLRIGQETHRLDLTDLPSHFEIDFTNPDGARVLWIEAPGACAPSSLGNGVGDPRDLAVGLSRLQILSKDRPARPPQPCAAGFAQP